MTRPGTTWLRLEDHRTRLAADGKPEIVIAAGWMDIAEALFRHDPPTPVEMEQAIDVVEDALAATGLHPRARGELAVGDPNQQALLGLTARVPRLSRDHVEDRFQRVASASLGHPRMPDAMPAGREAAAALLLLRECMHHLGYEAVRGTRPSETG